MKPQILLSVLVLIGTSALTSCSAGGGAQVSGSGIGSASVGGSGSISRNSRR